MNRSEFVLRLVLNWICDDYQNIDQVILPHVSEEGAKCGLVIGRLEIADALAQLIEDGFAKAYDLSRKDTDTELRGMPKVDLVESDFKTYFYITRRGMDFHLANDAWWPFDDEDDLRPDWHLSQEEF